MNVLQCTTCTCNVDVHVDRVVTSDKTVQEGIPPNSHVYILNLE